MTILEAFKSKVAYPLGEDTLNSLLITRGLDGGEEFTALVSSSKSFKGTVADLYLHLATVPNVSEGGMSISYNDKQTFLSLYRALKKEIGEDDNISGATCVFVGYKNV